MSPAAPRPTRTVANASPMQEYSAAQGGSFVPPCRGVFDGIPLPQAGPTAGSRSLRERLYLSVRVSPRSVDSPVSQRAGLGNHAYGSEIRRQPCCRGGTRSCGETRIPTGVAARGRRISEPTAFDATSGNRRRDHHSRDLGRSCSSCNSRSLRWRAVARLQRRCSGPA